MSKLVEHVACCLGESVTGNPTQFVLERLADMSRIDLRFFTAEVPANRLLAAVDGARAMNFDGLVFLQDIPWTSQLTFETYSEGVLRSGVLNVAKRVRSSWIADNVDGAAILDLLRSKGDVGSILVYGDEKIADLLCSADRSIRDQVTIVLNESADRVASNEEVHREAGLQQFYDPKQIISRHDLMESPRSCDILITSRSLSPLDTSLLRGSVTSETVAIELSNDQSSTKSPANEQLLMVKEWTTPTEVDGFRLAAVFEFLTGKKIDTKVIRDLIDEFSAW